MRLILTFFHSTGATAAEMEMPRRVSSGSKSVVVEPSSTLPWRSIFPAAKSIDSVSVVLPSLPCPIRATFRISFVW